MSNVDLYILIENNAFGRTVEQPVDLKNPTCRTQTQIPPTKCPQHIQDPFNNGFPAAGEAYESGLEGAGLEEGVFAEAFHEDRNKAQNQDIDLLDLLVEAQRYLAGLPYLSTSNTYGSKYPDEMDVQEYLAGLVPPSTTNEAAVANAIEELEDLNNEYPMDLPARSITKTAASLDAKEEVKAWCNGSESDQPRLQTDPMLNRFAVSAHFGNESSFSDAHFSRAEIQNYIAVATAPDPRNSTDNHVTETIGMEDENSIDANGWPADEFLGVGDLLFKYATRPMFDFDSI